MITELGLPVFVKPANMGSSVGIGKVKSMTELGDSAWTKHLSGIAKS